MIVNDIPLFIVLLQSCYSFKVKKKKGKEEERNPPFELLFRVPLIELNVCVCVWLCACRCVHGCVCMRACVHVNSKQKHHVPMSQRCLIKYNPLRYMSVCVRVWK